MEVTGKKSLKKKKRYLLKNVPFRFAFRFGYFVMKQPRRLDYSAEGGPTDSCSPLMSAGRGPFR